MFKFENLREYQESLKFNNEVYKLTSNFPKEELFGLTNQLRRASTSITLNIAEGTSRTKKDFRHFLGLARGSCYECVAILAIAKEQELISEEVYNQSYNTCLVLAKMISSLRTSLL